MSHEWTTANLSGTGAGGIPAAPRARASVPRRRKRRKAAGATFPELELFARRLEDLRLERGLTQRTLASRVRISANHYQAIAHAEANPTATVILRLAEALHVSVVDLLEPSPLGRDMRRSVGTAELAALVAAHRVLAEAVERVAGNER